MHSRVPFPRSSFHRSSFSFDLRGLLAGGLLGLVLGLPPLPAGAHGGVDHSAELVPTEGVLSWSSGADGADTLEGTFVVLWLDDGSPSGRSQHTLREAGETFVIEPAVAPEMNLWEFFGQRVVVSGDFAGTSAPLLDGSGDARVFQATSIVAPDTPIPPDTDDHALADSFPAKLAETAATLVVPPVAQAVAPGERSTLGEWGPTIDWPHVAVSAANLPDGRVLTFASNERTSFPGGTEFTYAVTWDPETGDFLDVNHPTHDMFCGHLTMLESGEVFVNGGRNHVPSTSVFDAASDTWTRVDEMNRGRWYPTSVAMPGGEVFTMIGSSGGQYPELWEPGNGWRLLTGMDFTNRILNFTGHYEQNWWPLINVAPDGRIFHSGPTPLMHYLDPSDNGSVTQVVPQITEWYPKHGTTVLYDEGKLLVAGGAISGGNTASTNRVMVIDINGASPDVREIAPMAHARKFQNGVILPNGEVLVVGGNTSGIKFNDTGSVLPAEIWDPVTEGWRTVAEMAEGRNYHSIALLLGDGRVLSAGGGLCGCSADHQTGQVYSPPYLFNPDGSLAPRPVISAAPEVVAAGGSYLVEATPGVSKFSLVKMSATTHAVNSDLRYADVAFTETESGRYTLALHANSNVLTPGYWMLFAVNDYGTPSLAASVQVSTATQAPPALIHPGDQFTPLGSPVDLALTGNDPNGDPLTYSATGLPGGLSLDPGTGRITGVASARGNFTVNASVTDGTATASVVFSWQVDTEVSVPGVVYEYFEGSFDLLPDFDSLTPVTSGTIATFDISPRARDNDFAFRFTGRIEIATAGSYTFHTRSDDGSHLALDGALVVDNDGLHAARTRSGSVTLAAGSHDIEVTFFEKGGQEVLEVEYEGPGVARQPIPASVLFHVEVGTANVAPAIDPIADQSNDQGDFVALTVTASDADGDPLTFSAADLPTGLAIGPSTGTISGTASASGTFASSVTVSDGRGGSDTVAFDWTVVDPTANRAPALVDPGAQVSVVGENVDLALQASDPDGDTLTFAASGLPSGLTLDAALGIITGVADTAGVFAVIISVDDGNGASDSVEIGWTVEQVAPITIAPIASSPVGEGVNVTYTASAFGGLERRYAWLFGDGTPETAPSASPSVSHTFAAPGRYVVTLTVTDSSGQSVLSQFAQAVHGTHTAGTPSASSSIVYQRRAAGDRVWNANPDNDTVTAFDALTGALVAEIAVDASPRTLAFAPDGDLWVTNKRSATISVIDPEGLVVRTSVALPRDSLPHGLVFGPGGAGYVALEGLGLVLELDAAGAEVGRVDVGPTPRHLSVTGDGVMVLASRFVTPPVPGEHTATPTPSVGDVHHGGEVVRVDAATLTVTDVVVLRASDRQDSEHSGRGVPNYLAAAAISPDGASIWVPSKQDNIQRGGFRDGRALTHDSTVRAITSRIDALAGIEDYPARIDHDDGAVPSAAAFGPFGSYLFVALEGSRSVAVVEPYSGDEIVRFDVGRAPQGIVVSPDGNTAYVHNFMDRTVSVHDVTGVVHAGGLDVTTTRTLNAVASERLAPEVLLGKQLFYDAADTRLSLQSYMSCAACHNDGGHDGRVWDLTSMGEGLRNTINLRGRAGMGHGPLHWSANFDEVQDFENQIRALAVGTGLMDDAHFLSGTVSEPLGDQKTGLSADLDALAAYVASLDALDPSPHRAADGAMSADAELGAAVFETAGCAACHAGSAMTDSGAARHDVGTITAASGSRLGALLDGFDTPTLRDLWATAPYLHDGSAATIRDAVAAHSGVTLGDTELDQVAAFLREDGMADLDGGPRLAAGVVTGIGDAWVDVVLPRRYDEMVVVATPQYGAGAAPVVTRVRQADGDRFSLRVQNPSGAPASGYTVHYVVAEQGVYSEAEHGIRMEAVRYLSSSTDENNSWVGEQRAYLETYTQPVVLGQVMSAADADWSVFWARGTAVGNPPSTSSLWVGKEVGEDSDTTRADETVGYLVIESGRWLLDDHEIEAGLGADTITGVGNGPPDVYGLGMQADVAVVSSAGMDGNNGGWPVLWGADPLAGGNLDLAYDEDQIGDSERSHTTEQVAYLAVRHDAGTPVNQSPSLVDPGAQSGVQGDVSTLTVTASDPDGDPLAWSASGLPTGLVIDAASGAVNGTLDAAGSFAVTVSVDDGRGGMDSVQFDWTVSAPPLGSGEILRQWWTGIGGTSVSDLRASSAFPNAPTGSEMLTALEGPTNWAENYGSRIVGYLHVPVSGSYRFFIASDDGGELWLSTDDDPLNAARIAHVPGWTSSREWGKYPEQTSAPIALNAGDRLYIEALQKEAGGGDNLAVAWEIAGAPREIIAGGYLSPYVPTVTAQLSREAESGRLFGNMTTGNASAASGGQYVHAPPGTGSYYNSPSTSHRVELDFYVTVPGSYRLRGYIHAANGSDNSFHVQVDGGSTWLWDTAQGTSYAADYVSHRNGADPVRVNLDAGPHTVTVYQREDGTRLDRLELVPD